MENNWREATDTAELDSGRTFPVSLLVAAWYDGQFGSTFVCEAEYMGGGYFGGKGGGLLGECVVTHWMRKPAPPPESAMLSVALSGKLSAMTKGPPD